MLKKISLIKKRFIERKGIYVFSSQLLLKIAAFIISVLAIRFIPKEIFGSFVYANSIISLLIPLIGLGAHQSLLRFGALLKSPLLKYRLFLYSLVRGILASLFLTCLVLFFSDFLTKNMPSSKSFLQLLSFSLISICAMELVKNYARVQFLNKLYAQIQNLYAIFFITIGTILIYFLHAKGYIIALVITPLFIFSIYFFKLKVKLKNKSIELNKKDFWSYGFFVGIGAIASQLLFSTDILFIGNMIENSEKHIAGYKVASLIPMSLLILPNSFLTTDFVHISKMHNKKKNIVNYIKDYIAIFSLLSVFLFGIIYLFPNLILNVLFGNEYKEYANIFVIFGISMLGSILFRMPFINILSALGKSSWNAYNAFLMLGLNIILNYFLINKYNVIGAAIATAITLWISGLLAFFFVLYYLKKSNRS